MSIHNYSVFKNSCIKTPIHPLSRLPTPCYERVKSANSTVNENSSTMTKNINNFRENETQTVDITKNSSSSSQIKDNNFMSLIDFYESIPEYNDINHLSEKEFYNQLEVLKRKQKEIKNYCYSSSYINKDFIDYENLNSKYTKNINSSSNVETTKLRELHSKTPPVRFSDIVKDCNEIDDNNYKKNSAIKPIRKSSAKSHSSMRSGTTYFNFSDDEPVVVPSRPKSGLRSKSCSPCRQISPKSLTVPKPFKMTQREEEERMLEDLMLSSKCFSPKETKSKPEGGFKANPVPLTSKIPLYKHIVAEQEHKNELAKLNSAIELQSQMKPFSFTENKTERTNSRCLSRSLSSPNLTTPSKLDKKIKYFKAKPCPKNLFSNYFYHRLWEDEYFRALNRKIRAEELLKISSLPPSMAKRDKSSKKCKHTKSQNSTSGSSKKGKKRKKSNKKRNSISDYGSINEKNNSNKQNPFITTSTEPFDFETEKRYRNRINKQSSTETTASSSNISSCRPSPTPIYPASRPNLAATLRAQYSRKKLYTDHDKEMVPPLRTQRNRIDWGVRKSPAWKTIYFDGTNDDDISLRLATRRAEEKCRKEEHEMNMELMRQRVRAAPLLLEGPTHWGPRVGKLSHSCGKESQDKLFRKTRKSRPASCCFSDTKTSYNAYMNLKKCERDEIDELDSMDVHLL